MIIKTTQWGNSVVSYLTAAVIVTVPLLIGVFGICHIVASSHDSWMALSRKAETCFRLVEKYNIRNTRTVCDTHWYCIEVVDVVQTHVASVLQQQRAVMVRAAVRAAVWAQPIAVAVHQNHVTVAAGRLGAARRLWRVSCCAPICVCQGLGLRISSSVQVLLAVGEPVFAAQLGQA